MGPSGLEPPTSRLSGVRSNHLSYEPIFVVLSVFCSSEPLFLPCPQGFDILDEVGFSRLKHQALCLCETEKFEFAKNGGDMRDRTADPLLAKQVLSQLSYTPISLQDVRPLN